jgi:hypothetical protein
MRIELLTLILGAIISTPLHAGPQKEVSIRQSPITKQKGEVLVQKADKLILVKHQLESAEKEFFEAFPSSFAEFNALFGYPEQWEVAERVADDPLLLEVLSVSEENKAYQLLGSYLYAFFNLRTIDRNALYNRIIDIASEGKWEADLVSYFRANQRDVVLDNLKHFCTLLAERNDQVIQGFWFFYFDGHHPPKQIPEELRKVKEMDTRIYQLMEAALKEAQKGACQGH